MLHLLFPLSTNTLFLNHARPRCNKLVAIQLGWLNGTLLLEYRFAQKDNPFFFPWLSKTKASFISNKNERSNCSGCTRCSPPFLTSLSLSVQTGTRTVHHQRICWVRGCNTFNFDNCPQKKLRFDPLFLKKKPQALRPCPWREKNKKMEGKTR